MYISIHNYTYTQYFCVWVHMYVCTVKKMCHSTGLPRLAVPAQVDVQWKNQRFARPQPEGHDVARENPLGCNTGGWLSHSPEKYKSQLG